MALSAGFIAARPLLPVSAQSLARQQPKFVCTQTPARVFDPQTSSLSKGIKSVAIGKHGTKPIPPALIPSLHEELSLDLRDEFFWLQRASFLGSLFVKKKLLDAEHDLLIKFCRNISYRAGRERDGPGGVITAGEILAAVSTENGELEGFALRLLNDEPLCIEECAELGYLLYSANDANVYVKALVAHVMRIRHETQEELAGLCIAVSKTLSPQFQRTNGSGFALLTEPFDGTATWDLITPLVAKRLLDWGLKPVMSVGKSSGPKYGPNLRDVCRELGIECARSSTEMDNMFAKGVTYGVCIDQQDASPGLSKWVNMRRTIIKRPAIATAEKYLDSTPGATSLFIGSAFHSAYISKMAYCAQAAGFPAYIIVGKGMEGSLGLGVSPKRKGVFVVGWRRPDGEYESETITFSPFEEGLTCSNREATKGQCDAKKTAERIRSFGDTRHGDEDDKVFGWRATTTIKAFDRALKLVIESGGVEGLRLADDLV